eukprot:gb/GECH01011913.1/.p1 GENE.gb/GECH01011913.1/~~gb/GECH01011913.1/.p1  ORF type:complete len:177 (+),score=46.82 gb/GECH01011913.1/:1-531(+)
MPAYHSSFNENTTAKTVCGCPLLPIKTKVKGPAMVQKGDENDIIDEVLDYFKPNMLFRSFSVDGPADRLLIYLTLYTHLCLKKIEKCSSKNDANRVLYQQAQKQFSIPGDRDFVLGGFINAPKTGSEGEEFRNYVKQAREELGYRLLERAFKDEKQLDKFWMQFTKRKFLNKVLNE